MMALKINQTLKNRIRTYVREDFHLTKNVVGSLQNCKLDAMEDLLTSKIEAIDEYQSTPESVTHRNNLRGLRAVLQELLCTINIDNRDLRRSFMPFGEAHALFLSFNPDGTNESLKDHHLKKSFRELLCHPENGLPVYVIANKYVLLRSQEVDLEHFIEQLLADIDATENIKESSRLTISYDLVQDMLNSMDSEWDKKVLKVLLGATHTPAELTSLGVGSRIQQ